MNFVETTFDLRDIKIVTNKSSFWAKRLALPLVNRGGCDGWHGWLATRRSWV